MVVSKRTLNLFAFVSSSSFPPPYWKKFKISAINIRCSKRTGACVQRLALVAGVPSLTSGLFFHQFPPGPAVYFHHVAVTLHNLQACCHQRSKNWLHLLRHCSSHCTLHASSNLSQERISWGVIFVLFFSLIYNLFYHFLYCTDAYVVVLLYYNFGLILLYLHYDIVLYTGTKKRQEESYI